jgi:TPR repeat protein
MLTTLLASGWLFGVSVMGPDAAAKLITRSDYAPAILLTAWRPLAVNGNSSAQLKLGMAYADGWGVRQDYLEASTWIYQSAAQGNARAQYELGRFFEHGLGVPKDRERAIEWYRKSAEQGYAPAQAALIKLHGSVGAAKGANVSYASRIFRNN